MGEPIPLAIVVGGAERREDLAELEGRNANYISMIKSPSPTAISSASSPTMSESGRPDDVENGAHDNSASKADYNGLPDEVKDPNIVSWDGPNDPANPINWPESLKWGNIAVIAAITFIT